MSQLISSKRCKQCDNKYTDKWRKWCEPCQINNLKKNFTNWTSGNKQVDSFIQERQERQLEIYPNDKLFEWIPYNQFNNLKEIGKSDLFMTYSAVWKDGPLYYNHKDKKEWIRESGKKAVLEYFSQLAINKLLN